ncbi:hypothetical protein WK57_34400 [Burkholderia ubonensis]|uniref:Inclusion body protein n=1 Tax=Burkholderia ubonensis TaxID=101571 RepID=A0AA40R6D0_9BURK|nr:AidA/PixA family protein [Burkholderia ubonensis]KVD59004.1 hypothetical protein WI88_15845 [Burkholderia ubonensis]KVU24550.1 hypothetical protein WK64_27325 [Burkholderia ubonensis]KWC54878.1 hypothetical protein WL54_26780 [Burkholderia ubonensis]KWO17313.1 hypothetical protein WM25_13420 [Burkholderia ubonensis]KWO89976.1 hypothetical protein WM32_05650 [Burkholderia ubonensis]
MSNKSTFEIIDILTVLDIETILQNQSPLSNTPYPATGLQGNVVYMLTADKNAISGQGKSELNIKADGGDVIRWRTVSVSDESDYKAYIYAINYSEGADLLSGATPFSTNFDEPYPPQGWPKSTNELKDENRADFFWQTTAVGEGKATYQLIVAIYDRKKNLKGYVTWDPYITISN